MTLVQRVTDAMITHDTVAGIMANVVYMGYAELRESGMHPQHIFARPDGEYEFMGLRVVQVRLQSWLQVTYKEGA